MFHVEEHKLHAEKLMFQAEKYKFPVLEHKNKHMAETFVRQTGKKSRTERKENEIILNRRKRALEQKQNPRCC